MIKSVDKMSLPYFIHILGGLVILACDNSPCSELELVCDELMPAFLGGGGGCKVLQIWSCVEKSDFLVYTYYWKKY